ncbi:TIR domain-containing protein [Sorangium sp. So ce385]|uniref:toll/interleukin-1 receptor domain-containing protein n=1 Tax=Sorangium sp. So ce385 TaxID=3133308 RepID=UPI003F5C133F
MNRDADHAIDGACMNDGVQRRRDELPRVESVIVFLSCAREDEGVRERLERHLTALERDGRIRLFHEGRVAGGASVQPEVKENLRSARIVLLLVSADFLHAKCAGGGEVEISLERQRRGEVEVIPVLVRPCDLTSSPFGDIRLLPNDGRPVSQHEDPEEAIRDVAIELRKAVDKLTGAAMDDVAGKRGDALAGSRVPVTRAPRARMLVATGLVAAGSVAVVMIDARHAQPTTLIPATSMPVKPAAGSVADLAPPRSSEGRSDPSSVELVPPAPRLVPPAPREARGEHLSMPSRPSPAPSVAGSPASAGASAPTPGVSIVQTGDLVVGDGGRVAVGNRKDGTIDVETGAVTLGAHAGARVGNITQAEMPATSGVRVRTGDVKAGDGATIDIGNVH